MAWAEVIIIIITGRSLVICRAPFCRSVSVSMQHVAGTSCNSCSQCVSVCVGVIEVSKFQINIHIYRCCMHCRNYYRSLSSTTIKCVFNTIVFLLWFIICTIVNLLINCRYYRINYCCLSYTNVLLLNVIFICFLASFIL